MAVQLSAAQCGPDHLPVGGVPGPVGEQQGGAADQGPQGVALLKAHVPFGAEDLREVVGRPQQQVGRRRPLQFHAALRPGGDRVEEGQALEAEA